MGRINKGGSALRTRKHGKTHAESNCGEVNTKLSLPDISLENFSSDDKEIVEKDAELILPKVKITCEALNYERIIDYANNKIISNKIQKFKKPPAKSAKPVNSKTKCKKFLVKDSKKKDAKKPAQKNVKKPVQRKVNKHKEKEAVKSVKSVKEKSFVGSVHKSPKQSESKPVSVLAKNSKILDENSSLKENKSLCEDSPKHCGEKSAVYNFRCTTKESNNKDQEAETSAFGDPDVESSINLHFETLNARDSSCSPLHLLEEDLAFFDFSEGNLEELFQSLDGIFDKEIISEHINNKMEDIAETNSGNKTMECDYTREKKNQSAFNNVSKDLIVSKISLQTAVETFMNNPQIKYLKGSTALKRGLCFSWLSNNYKCSNQQCLYNHNAVNLFTRKLKKYPSKFVMTVVVSMRNDLLFVDVVLSAFKVISERQIPVVWVTFLTFFVFYVTEPSDSRFLKFWATAARFFCDLQKNCLATSGFASLLAIFSHIEKSEQWKIIEFIKLIKQPPVQICVNFTLLQPVLKMDLPLEFLTAAIESSIAKQKDLLKVYWLVVPKISIMTSPIEIVELLLKFCKILEDTDHKDFADDLKQRLRGKVSSVQTKINHQKYPLTASFQEAVYSNEDNCFVPSVSLPEEELEMQLPLLGSENAYFQPEKDFCNFMAQAMEISKDTVPKPFRNSEDIGERQITRIKQFFRDRQFDLLGKYLNELKPNITERAAEEFLKLLFRMKISLEQGVDLLKIILLSCKSENAAKVIASISVTLILNLVKINEWEKAYTIVSLCQEKQINIVEGKVFCTNEFNTVTQCRIVLLLIEIHAYKENYTKAVDLVKKHFLFSSNNSLWRLTSKADDEIIRVRILEDLLEQIISKQLTHVAHGLFQMIWKEQKQLLGPVDLRKFINETLILLLNEDNEGAINLYEQIKSTCVLNATTIRAIVVTLVRRNRLSEAKTVVNLPGQNVYFTPKITKNSATVKVLSFWLEEEIYIVFESFFDFLIANQTGSGATDYNNVEVQLEESKPNPTSSGLRPLCLGIITASLKDACTRIQRVLQHQFNPPVKLIVMPYCLKLDEFSVKLHLQKRMKNSDI